MRTYLVVVDESPESAVALRFAARRAVKTNGGVEVLALVEPQEFAPWGGVQATIEEEAKERAEALVQAAMQPGTVARLQRDQGPIDPLAALLVQLAHRPAGQLADLERTLDALGIERR